MSKMQGRFLIAIITILIAVFVTNTYAQYNGECWAVDYLGAIKISGGKAIKIAGFSQPLSVSINPGDGSVWVADTDAIRVKKLSSTGKVLLTIDKGFSTNPASVAVDPKDGSCWVADTTTLFKFSSEGKQISTKEGFNEPTLIVNPKNSELWIADSNNSRVVKMSSDGSQLGVFKIDGIGQPKSISINSEDGTCWVLDPFTMTVVKLSPDGKPIIKVSVSPPGGATMATSVSASSDGGCWVAIIVDFTKLNQDIVIKLSADGKQTGSYTGFSMPSTVCFDPKDKGCWVADSNNGRIVKLSAAGQKVVNLSGFGQPKAVTVAYPVKK